MVAIDKCDQMVAYSCFRQWIMKWWKKMFFQLISLGNECLHPLQAKNPVICAAKNLPKEACEGAWNLAFSHSKRPPKEVSQRVNSSSSWRSLPRENTGHWALGTGHWALGTGHWEEVQHHLSKWGLLSCPKEVLGKEIIGIGQEKSLAFSVV